MNNNNSSNAIGVSATIKPAKVKKEKVLTPSVFCKQTGKFFAEKPDTIKLREYVKQHKDFILKFDFGHKILDLNLDDKETLTKVCEKFYEMLEEEVNDKLVSAEKKAAEKKIKQGVSASVFAQVWDKKKREYTDDYEIAIIIDDEGKEKKLVEFFPTEHEAYRWAANKLVTLSPGIRFYGEIVDMRGENPHMSKLTYDQADKIKNTNFKGTQVTKTNTPSATKPNQMKAKGDKFSFSKG
jgi:hypothetical protein